MGWPIVLLACPGQGLGGQAECFSQPPRAVDSWSCGSELTAEDVASCCSTKPEVLTLKHKRYSVLYVCIAVWRCMCRCVFAGVCERFAFLCMQLSKKEN